ncbi:hypothetical protein ACLOJK_006849 [Asimina triloba]
MTMPIMKKRKEDMTKDHVLKCFSGRSPPGRPRGGHNDDDGIASGRGVQAMCAQ